MNVHELKSKFLLRREYETDNVNDLLDFAKNAYINNEISINEYRNLVRELEAQGAEVATSDIDHSLIEN